LERDSFRMVPILLIWLIHQFGWGLVIDLLMTFPMTNGIVNFCKKRRHFVRATFTTRHHDIIRRMSLIFFKSDLHISNRTMNGIHGSAMISRRWKSHQLTVQSFLVSLVRARTRSPGVWKYHEMVNHRLKSINTKTALTWMVRDRLEHIQWIGRWRGDLFRFVRQGRITSIATVFGFLVLKSLVYSVQCDSRKIE
jgi:hypothetical protein